MAPKIAYVMSRFPHLPETFILREMTELERQGWQVALYPLIRQRQPVVHAEAEAWIPRAHYVPFASAGVVAANGRALLSQPRCYVAAWGRTLMENLACPNHLIRAIALLPKAMCAARLMQQEGIAHIHAHYATHPALVAWLIHRLTGITYSVTVHSQDIYKRTAMLATKLRDAAFVVTISEYNLKYLAKIVGPWVEGKTHVIHCGVLLSNYAEHVPLPRQVQRFELLNIGTLNDYKGQAYLVDACALLRDRGIPIRCRIVGDGENRSRLEHQITHAGLGGRVELLGSLPEEEVTAILPTAHCYVQPSISEGIPVALMEALACALPVVATSITGVPELVRPGETGYLVPPADVVALADALAAVYADPDGADRLARAGRNLVLQEYNLRANVARLASLFETVIPGELL